MSPEPEARTAIAPIRRLADLPFEARPPLALLALDVDKDAPDADFAGFGHGRLAALWLADDGGGEALVEDALVLALHSADGAPPAADDVELEFVVDAVAPGYAVTAPLSAFLAARLPALRGSEGAIVLAMCNPHGATLAQPAAAGTTPVHYADGDVESWREIRDDGDRLWLRARAWRLAGAEDPRR